MTTPVIRRRTLAEQLRTHLEALPRPLLVYVGEVPEQVPVKTVAGTPDPEGRVAAYVVLYTAPGAQDIEASLGDCQHDLLWQFQLTVAGGFQEEVEDVLDDLVPHVRGWEPTLPPELAAGSCRPVPGYDPGPIRRDDDPKPPRHYTPLLWQLPVTT